MSVSRNNFETALKKDLSGVKVLITGAAGCIGAWCVKVLQDCGAIPIIYDLSDNRSRLEMVTQNADKVIWEQGDITDYQHLMQIIERHYITAIIHLAALQVPFCIADPIGSTRINIMGSINILEAARQNGIKRLCYASSVAAPAMGDNDYLATLYGAHKICGEQMAGVYWQDWQTPSIGIRPGIIYGPARDQGMSAAPSLAALAAFEGHDYTVPFSGPLTFCHAEDAAYRFVAAISKDQSGAPVFEMNGTPAETLEIVTAINAYSQSNITFMGEAMPFPALKDNGALDSHLGVPPYRALDKGIKDTITHYETAKARGFDTKALAKRLLERL